MLKNKLINAGIDNLSDEQIRRLEDAISIIHVVTGSWVEDEIIRLLTPRAADGATCACPRVDGQVYHVVGCWVGFLESPRR